MENLIILAVKKQIKEENKKKTKACYDENCRLQLQKKNTTSKKMLKKRRPAKKNIKNKEKNAQRRNKSTTLKK